MFGDENSIFAVHAPKTFHVDIAIQVLDEVHINASCTNVMVAEIAAHHVVERFLHAARATTSERTISCQRSPCIGTFASVSMRNQRYRTVFATNVIGFWWISVSRQVPLLIPHLPRRIVVTHWASANTAKEEFAVRTFPICICFATMLAWGVVPLHVEAAAQSYLTRVVVFVLWLFSVFVRTQQP